MSKQQHSQEFKNQDTEIVDKYIRKKEKVQEYQPNLYEDQYLDQNCYQDHQGVIKHNLTYLQYQNLNFYESQLIKQENHQQLHIRSTTQLQFSYENSYNQIQSYNQEGEDVFSSLQDERLKRRSKRSSEQHIQIQGEQQQSSDLSDLKHNQKKQSQTTLKQHHTQIRLQRNFLVCQNNDDQTNITNSKSQKKLKQKADNNQISIQSNNNQIKIQLVKKSQTITNNRQVQDFQCNSKIEEVNVNLYNQKKLNSKVYNKDNQQALKILTPKKCTEQFISYNWKNQNKLTWSNQAQSSPFSNIPLQRFVQKPPEILFRFNESNPIQRKNNNYPQQPVQNQYKGFEHIVIHEQSNIVVDSNADSKQKQKNYQQQMQDDMQMLQKSMNSKKTKTSLIDNQKIKQKAYLNKTHMPNPNTTINAKIYLSKKEEDESSLSKNQDLRMLLKISLQKKKQNYQLLKQWDKKRAENMALHRNMIEMMQNQIDKKIKSSLQNFEIYTTFFREKIKQQQKFVNSHVLNTKYALQNNSISKNIYINCSVILNSLSQQNSNRVKKVSEFANILKSNIFNGLMDIHLHDSQKELLKIREKISTLKSSLKKYNTQTEQKTQSLTVFFTQNASNLINTSTKSQNDFYFQQLQFLRCASQQILIQKKLGQNCLEYYHTAISQQKKRSNVIKQAMITYVKGLKQTYKTQIQQAQIEQMSKNEQMKLIEEYYSLEQMFDQRSLKLFRYKLQQIRSSNVNANPNNTNCFSKSNNLTPTKKQDQKKELIQNQSQSNKKGTKQTEQQVQYQDLISDEINIQNFTAYIENFNYSNFNSRMLLLKQFNAFYYSPTSTTLKQSVKNNTMREQTCYIAITVDCFLHLFFSMQKTGSHPKPDVTLKIHSKQIQLKETQKIGNSNSNQFIDIVKKEQRRSSMISYFWQSKGNDKSYRIKFRNRDVKQEFCDYIKKLM